MTDLKAKMAGLIAFDSNGIRVHGGAWYDLAQQQAALIETLLKPLHACDEAMHYMCEYEIPLSLPYDVKQALQSAKEAGYEV